MFCDCGGFTDMLLGLSMVRQCSLNRSFKRRLVSPIYCILFLPNRGLGRACLPPRLGSLF